MSLRGRSAIPRLSPARDLLRSFALAWAGEAARALPRGGSEEPRREILLADCFAGADYPAPSSALPGICGAAARLARDGRVRGRSRVLAVEEDPAKVRWLEDALGGCLSTEALEGSGERLRWVEPSVGGPGVLEGLTAQSRSAWRALVMLDPPSAGKLPLSLVLEWLGEGSAELMIHFPAADLRRLARYRGSALADLPTHVKRTVEGMSRLLGDSRDDWLYGWTRAVGAGVEDAIGGIVAAYAGRFSDLGAIVRVFAFAADGGVEHLLLVTRTPSTALLLNRVVHELREAGVLPWPDSEQGAVRYVEAGELPLFGRDAGAPVHRERRVDRAGLGDSLARRFAGRSLRIDEVLRGYVDTDLFAEEIRRALLDLRRDGRAAFRASIGDAEIVFAPPGARGMHHRGARRRPARVQELTLALDPEPVDLAAERAPTSDSLS